MLLDVFTRLAYSFIMCPYMSSPMTIPTVQDRLHAVGSTASKGFLGLTYVSLVILHHCPQQTRAKIATWTWGCTPRWRMSWARWSNAMTNWQGICPRLLLPRIQFMRSLPFSRHKFRDCIAVSTPIHTYDFVDLLPFKENATIHSIGVCDMHQVGCVHECFDATFQVT